MIVNQISAHIRMARQVPSGEWITVELGAEAIYVEESDLTWREQQSELFGELKSHLAELVPVKAHAAQQAPEADQADRNPQHVGDSVDRGTGEIRCPVHKISRDSRHGGLMCPGKVDGGDWCTWTHAGPKALAAPSG